MPRTLERLLLVVEADSKTMRADLAKAEAVARRSGKNIEKSFRGLERRVSAADVAMKSFRGGLVLTAGVAGLFFLVKRAIQTADAIGISTDALQELRFAAERSGVAIEALDKSLKFATKSVGELRTRTDSELVTALKNFDAVLLDNIRDAGSMEEAIDLVFKAMGDLEDQTQRAALAKAFFGRQGVALTNIVREGTAGYRAMREEAHRLGIILAEELVRGAEAAQDALTNMERVVGVNITRLGLGLAPTIIRLSAAFVEWAPAIKAVVDAFLPLQLMSLQGLEQELDDINKQIARFRDENFAGLLSPFIRDLEQQAFALGALITQRRKELALIQTALDAPAGEGAVGAAAGKILANLKLQADEQEKLLAARIEGTEALRQATREIAVNQAIRKAGADVSKADADAIRETTLRLLDAAEAQKRLTGLASETAKEQAESGRQRNKDLALLTALEVRAARFAFTEKERLLAEEAALLESIDDLKERGVIDEQERLRRRMGSHLEFNERLSTLAEEAAEKQKRLAKEVADAQTAALDRVLGVIEVVSREGKLNWASLARAAISAIQSIQKAQEAASASGGGGGGFFGSILSLFGGGGGGSSFTTLTAGISAGTNLSGILGTSARKHGGPVSPNVAYTVGEGGEETFVPRVPGFILPHGAIAGGGSNMGGAGGGAVVNITQYNDFRGADRASEARIRAALEQNKRETMAAILADARSGGAFAKMPRRT